MDEVLDYAARRVVLPVIKKAPLEDINKVVEQLAEGRILGKVVLEIKE